MRFSCTYDNYLANSGPASSMSVRCTKRVSYEFFRVQRFSLHSCTRIAIFVRWLTFFLKQFISSLFHGLFFALLELANFLNSLNSIRKQRLSYHGNQTPNINSELSRRNRKSFVAFCRYFYN